MTATVAITVERQLPSSELGRSTIREFLTYGNFFSSDYSFPIAEKEVII
jgi:hypothetical protein